MSTDASNVVDYVFPPLGEHADVFFPPRQYADFIIHYDTKDFYVHKFVLHHHSAYFRAYFQTLPPPAPPRGRQVKRRKAKRSNSPAADEGKEDCDHPSIAHCIHLPQQSMLVQKKPVTAAHFRLFLCHLYFSSHYSYPPFLPKADVDLDADTLPTSLAFPPVASLDWGIDSTPLRFADDASGDSATKKVWKEALLMLAHYLDCAQMMQHCEAVLLTMVNYGAEERTSLWLAKICVPWLRFADRYGLKQWRAACVSAIANAPDSLLAEDKYKKARKKWSRAMLIDVMEAAIRERDIREEDSDDMEYWSD